MSVVKFGKSRTKIFIPANKITLHGIRRGIEQKISSDEFKKYEKHFINRKYIWKNYFFLIHSILMPFYPPSPRIYLIVNNLSLNLIEIGLNDKHILNFKRICKRKGKVNSKRYSNFNNISSFNENIFKKIWMLNNDIWEKELEKVGLYINRIWTVEIEGF